MSEDFDRLMRALRLTDTTYCEELRPIAIEKTIEKGQKLGDADKHNVMFLMSGLMRGYIIDKNGEEITDCFMRRYAEACTPWSTTKRKCRFRWRPWRIPA